MKDEGREWQDLRWDHGLSWSQMLNQRATLAPQKHYFIAHLERASYCKEKAHTVAEAEKLQRLDSQQAEDTAESMV